MGKLHQRSLPVAGLFFDDPAGMVAGSGWDLTGYPGSNLQYFYLFGGIMQFEIRVTRTGGNINVPQDGDLTNELLCTLPVSLRGTVTRFLPASSGVIGRVATGAIQPSTGEVYMTAVAGSTNISNGDTFTMGGLVLMEVV